MTPKSLLRHPLATSSTAELTSGRFEPVLHDVATSAEGKRVIITSGKVYYDLKHARDHANANVAILRLEQYYPFPSNCLSMPCPASRTPPRSSGCRKSRATWAPGRSSTSG